MLCCQLNKGMIKAQISTDYPAPKLRNLAGSRFAGEDTRLAQMSSVISVIICFFPSVPICEL